MSKLVYVGSERPEVERIAGSADAESIELGGWYWFAHNDKSKEFDTDDILCCVMGIGSNYAEIEHPGTGSRGWSWRVHFSEWDEVCRREANPQTWFDQWAHEEKRAISRINAEIKDLCTRLGVDPAKKRITDNQSGGSLSLVSAAVDTSEYKAALIKAKETDLPALFGQIKEHSSELTRWMGASALSMRAKCGDMAEAIEMINDRIFTVSIYAGLTEDVVLVRGGNPAGIGEKLRLMQGKLFMDEECLLNYMHGGIDFDRIEEFDEWLCREENTNRILPFSRCMVAFQVRRHKKNRDEDGSLHTAWINIELAELDKLTFLYIRNGERLYRLNTDIEFGHELFADRDEFNFDEPVMVNNRFNSHETMPIREFEVEVEKHNVKIEEHDRALKEWKRQRALFKKWKKANPKADESESGFNSDARMPFEPRLHSSFQPEDWSVLDDSNVYVDDVNDKIRDRANHYNRISTLIQGLLDRSETLHPHPPVKLWTPQGFESFIELIYDHDRTLYDGPEPPSWELYKAKCNETIGVGSIVTGQYEFWHASLPRVRESRSDYLSIPYRYIEGNPGPGNIVQEWSARTKKATFRWKQVRYIFRRSRYERSGDREYDRSISVPVAELFNISGYKPGDFKQFFNDPRTRRAYHQWAHLLLTAEEYYAGNLDPVTLKKRDKPIKRGKRK